MMFSIYNIKSGHHNKLAKKRAIKPKLNLDMRENKDNKLKVIIDSVI